MDLGYCGRFGANTKVAISRAGFKTRIFSAEMTDGLGNQLLTNLSKYKAVLRND